MIRQLLLVVLIFCGGTVRGQGTGSVTAPQLTLEEAISSKARMAQEQYNNPLLRNTIASQKKQRNNLLGRDIRADISVVEVPEPTGPEDSLEAAQTKALVARPELREGRLHVQQAELNRRITKADYIPEVSLALSNLSLTNVSLLPSNVASAGILSHLESDALGTSQARAVRGQQTNRAVQKQRQ